MARGHEIDPAALMYRKSDTLCAAVRVDTTAMIVFADTSGRCYTLAAHTLPSAKGGGEPLSSRFHPPDGADFTGLACGLGDDASYLLCADDGRGFVTRFADMQTRMRAGRQVLRIAGDARALRPAPVAGLQEPWVAVLTDRGYLLVFTADALPRLASGRGNKLIHVPPDALASRTEQVCGATVIDAGEKLLLKAGNRMLTLKPRDWEAYKGERGRRGRLLPGGYRRVTDLCGSASLSLCPLR